MRLSHAEPEGPPKRPESARDLDFERKPMIRWLEPGVLVDAGMRVVLSSVFGAYADKREMQAFAPVARHHRYDAVDGELWLDFVADLGDGFDPTYAIACLLAREQLELVDQRGDTHVLPRGRVLVMGGDQVYPSANREEYENRFRGPYRAAFPWATAGQRPDLFAIPGNHDWYDGLTNFLRFFCSSRWIGAWQTRQQRSYFALRLSHRWWVLGLDIQLDSYIDEPQLTYFRNAGLEPGDRVILVTGKPSWVKVRPDHEPDSYKNLRYFKQEVIEPAGAEVRLTLSGDLHHYYRYEAKDGSQLVTAGGGGAYLFPTHTLEGELSLPDCPDTYHRKGCYPPREDSKRLTLGALRLPKLAPRLCVLIGLFDAGFALALFAALDGRAGVAPPLVIAALVMLCLTAYAAAGTWPRKLALGGAHGLAQLTVAAIAPVALELAVGADGAWAGVLGAAAAGVLGFGLGGVVFGLYLVLSHRRAPKHANEVFACQAIADYKCFARLRIDESGVTIYPVGLRHSPCRWAFAPAAPETEPWMAPTDRPLQAELIEPPIHVPASVRDTS
jgi:hypothetical protein